MRIFTADFETTVNPDDCRVWAWGVCEIGNESNFLYGNDIKTFIDFMESEQNSVFYFHNLKFDGEFIMSYLFKNGYEHKLDKKYDENGKRIKSDMTDKTFTTLISDVGQFYSMKIMFKKGNKKPVTAKIYDSLKILPFSVEEISKGFNLPLQKLEIDYKQNRPIGHELTHEEIEYLRNDVEIVARALNILFEQGLTKMTNGSNALYDFKQTISEKKFNYAFPVPDYDSDIRQAYRGGYTYVNKLHQGYDVGEGLVFDVNSLYPYVLAEKPLPYGEGIYFTGKYKDDFLCPLYVQMFTCQFELKDGFIPTIQLKKNLSFLPTEYITSSGNEFVTMCLTSVDMELFFKHYDVYNIEYHSGWMFKASNTKFKPYIDKWMNVKEEASRTGNKAMRTLSKLMMNALYGKMGTSPRVCSKIPYYDEDEEIIKYRYGDEETKDPIYLPVALFVTAWARHITISLAQEMGDKFCYADTDSLHIITKIPDSVKSLTTEELENLTSEDLKKHGINIPDSMEIHPTKLGAWKCENLFHRARFIRAKCYIEDGNTAETWDKLKENYDSKKLKITCAGMPKDCYKYVTWDNFKEGSTFGGKLLPKRVTGGIVLKETEFTIRKA